MALITSGLMVARRLALKYGDSQAVSAHHNTCLKTLV